MQFIACCAASEPRVITGLFPRAPPCCHGALWYSLDAPLVLPLKRPCSLSRTKGAITDPKFGVYMKYIYKLQAVVTCDMALLDRR